MGDANVDRATVKWTRRAWEGGAERAKALSRERAAIKLTGWPREGGAEGADTDAEGAAVNQTGQSREGGAEGARALLWERVRPGGQVEEGSCSSQTLIAVDLVPVSNGSECVKEKN